MAQDIIKQLVEKYTSHICELRRTIHAHPELSYQEEGTAALVAAEFRSLGLEVHEHVGGIHAVVGILHGGKGKGLTIALRADMDALPVTEETGLPFASETPGVMHACGHDAHTSILLGTARVLTAMKDTFAGTVLFIGQPAEEKSPDGGAKAVVRSGILEGTDAVYGLHVWPGLPTGQVGILAGPMMAASDHVTVTICGKASHAAMPHRGTDAIVAAGQFLTAVQNIISRQINPLYPAVLTFGTIHGGTRYNIVADKVIIEGTCRTYHKEAQDMVEDKLQRLLSGLDTMLGTESTLQYDRGYDAVFNDAEQAEFIKDVVRTRFGEEALANVREPAMTAEDFSGYLKAYNGAFLWLGATAPGKPVWPLHNSHFAADENCLPFGMELMTSLVLAALYNQDVSIIAPDAAHKA